MKKMLKNVRPEVALAGIAIMSVGIFISEKFPEPKSILNSEVYYEAEIPGYGDITITDHRVKDLGKQKFHEDSSVFPPGNSVYLLEVDFELSRTDKRAAGPYFLDAKERLHTGIGIDCAPEVVPLPTRCTASIPVPNDALGEGRFLLTAGEHIGGGFHRQDQPLYPMFSRKITVREADAN